MRNRKKKHHRFREAGEEANVNNVARFGQPHHSLFTSSKVLTLHHRIEITDDNENVVYRANTKFPSIHDKTDVTDAMDRQVAHIERKFFSIHQRHFITMADGMQFELSSELLHLIKDIINIEGLPGYPGDYSSEMRKPNSIFPLKIKKQI